MDDESSRSAFESNVTSRSCERLRTIGYNVLTWNFRFVFFAFLCGKSIRVHRCSSVADDIPFRRPVALQRCREFILHAGFNQA